MSSPSDPRLVGGDGYSGRHRRRAGDRTPPTGQSAVLPRTAETPVARPPMNDAEDPSSLSNWAVSHLRTYVPLAWGAASSWAITRWPEAEELLRSSGLTVAGPVFLTAAATALWYGLARWVEPLLPDALTAIVLGHAQPPTYPERARRG